MVDWTFAATAACLQSVAPKGAWLNRKRAGQLCSRCEESEVETLARENQECFGGLNMRAAMRATMRRETSLWPSTPR